jgi:DNA primase catalytic subunit
LKFKKDITVLKEYYKNSDLWLPESPESRHFRFFLSQSKVIKIKSRIKNTDDLRKHLIKYTPITVHYSISRWEDPTEIGSKFYKKNKNSGIILGNDLIFDVDNPILEKSRLESLKIIDLMNKWGYPLKSIMFSGKKGFHIEFIDIVPDPKIEDNIIREEYFVNKRKDLITQLCNNGIVMDHKITINTRALMRLPLTINSATGYICTPISLHDLRTKSLKELLSNIQRLNYTGVADGVDFENSLIKKLRYSLNSKIRSLMPKSYGLTYDSYFFINKVYGLKENYIPVFRYNDMLLPEVLKTLKNLQKKFSLTDIYLFRTNVDDEYYAFCIKTFHKSKIIKILKDSHSSNKRIIYSFKPEFMRISPKYSNQEKIVACPELIKILKSDKETNNNSFVSAAHKNLLDNLKAYSYNYPLVHGSPNMNYYHSFIVNGALERSVLLPWKDVKL